MSDSQATLVHVANKVRRFKWPVYDSETAYLFEPVNIANLFSENIGPLKPH